MNISQTITIIIFTILSFNILSQDNAKKNEPSNEIELKFGEPYPIIDASIKTYTSKNGTIISCKIQLDQVTIQMFSGSHLNQTTVKTYNDFPKGFLFTDYIEINDSIYILFSSYNKSNKTEELFIRKINKLNGQFDGNSERIITVNGKISGGNRIKFYIKQSLDGSKILIYHRKNPDDKIDNINKDTIGVYVFTEQLAEIWHKDVEMPYTEAVMENIDYIVENDANVLILTKVKTDFDSEKKLSKGDKSIDYELISICKSDNLIKTNIAIEGKYINQAHFFEGKNNAILIGGTYSYPATHSTNGFFYCNINEEKDHGEFIFFDIPIEIVEQFTTEEDQKKIADTEETVNKAGIESLILRQIIFDTDDSILLIGEKYQSGKAIDNSGNLTYIYYSEEILVTKIDLSGNPIFIKKIPKKQFLTSFSPPGKFTLSEEGYHFTQSSNNYYFTFLDNVSNLEISESKVPAWYRGRQEGILVTHQINKTSGEIKKLPILSLDNTNGYSLYQFAIGRIVDIGNNEFALECYIKKKQDIMIRIKIKD